MKLPHNPTVPGSPEEWLAHARSDANLAQLAKGRQDVLAEQVCFHAQQAVEKALKAVLLFRHVDFPLTHDLEALVELLESHGVQCPSEVAQVDTLTPYAVETRYPGSFDDIRDEDVDEAIWIATRVLVWAEAFLNRP